VAAEIEMAVSSTIHESSIVLQTRMVASVPSEALPLATTLALNKCSTSHSKELGKAKLQLKRLKFF